MQPAILGIGTAVPSMRITQAQSVRVATVVCAEREDHSALLDGLYRQSGIEHRHVVYDDREVGCILNGSGDCDSPFIPSYPGDPGPTTALRMERYHKEARPLAIEAARKALAHAEIRPSRLTHLVTVSCTGFAAPGIDIWLMKDLGLPVTVERTHVGFMGCHGALNGLRVARGLVAAEPGASILICSVELCSLHYFYGWNPKKLVGNALFADGAAAAVMGAEGSSGAWRLAANGGCVFPDSEAAMAWHVSDHGFDMTLSTKVPHLIHSHLRPWLDEWLARNGLSVPQVRSWAIHPGGPRVLSNVQETLQISSELMDVSREVLRLFGNMSSATVLFIIQDLMQRDAPLPCVALGFGPGLAAEVALFV